MAADPRIDAYIAKARPFARPILERIRAAVHAAGDGIEETLKWRAPAYLWNGRILCITASFKAHVAINFWRGKELDFERAEVAADPEQAMGQLGRIESESDLPAIQAIAGLVKQAIALEEAAPAEKPAAKKKPAVKVPPIPKAFAEALAANPKAKRHFDGFPPGARRDYVEWIVEAKREATRDKRIATAIEWLAQGKRRHWKYQNC